MAFEHIKFMEICPVCGDQYQYGPHRYEGAWLEAYGIQVCDTCKNGNFDGWAPHLEPRLLKVLKAKGLPAPERNERGFLPFNP